MVADVIDISDRLPTQDEANNAGEAAAALANARESDGSVMIRGVGGTEVRLTQAVAEPVISLLSHLAQGNMVTLVPTGAMLTTQQAADLLNVSRPYLSGLLKKGVIKYVQVGAHRRVPFDALMRYKADRDAGRLAALAELARLGQEYDDG